MLLKYYKDNTKGLILGKLKLFFTKYINFMKIK
jgi:hypothetical protein